MQASCRPPRGTLSRTCGAPVSSFDTSAPAAIGADHVVCFWPEADARSGRRLGTPRMSASDCVGRPVGSWPAHRNPGSPVAQHVPCHLVPHLERPHWRPQADQPTSFRQVRRRPALGRAAVVESVRGQHLDGVELRGALLQQHARVLHTPSGPLPGPCRNDKGELPAGEIEEMSLSRCPR